MTNDTFIFGQNLFDKKHTVVGDKQVSRHQYRAYFRHKNDLI